MNAFKLLISSDAGLASLAVILFMIAMAGYIWYHVRRLMKAAPGKEGWD